MFSPTGLGFGDSIFDLQLLNHLNKHTERDEKEVFTRLEWCKHIEQQVRRRRWNGKYHMSPDTFAKLVDLLRPMLEVDPIRLGTHEPIIPEVVVAIGVRYLGGCNMKEFDETLRVSYPSAWRLTDKFLNAVLHCGPLSFELPTSPESLLTCAKDLILNPQRMASSSELLLLLTDGFVASTSHPMSLTHWTTILVITDASD
jgi:hypothetical protein